MLDYKMLVYMVIASWFIASTQQQLLRQQKAVPECKTSGESFCKSCSVVVDCVSILGELKEFNETCATGSTCDSTTYTCQTTLVTGCSCQVPTGLSYQADPYNEHWFVFCNDKVPTYVDCGPQYFDGSSGCRDDPLPLPTCAGPGVFSDVNDPTCAGYVICTAADSSPSFERCPTIGLAPGYFDPTTGVCSSLPSKFDCADVPGSGTGAFGDPYDCRQYYVCVRGNLQDAGCCDINQIYDVNTSACIPDDGSCTNIECSP